MGSIKKTLQGGDSESIRPRQRKKVNNFKVLKEPGKKGEHFTDSRSPDSKSSFHGTSGGNSAKVRDRMTPIGMHSMSTSKRLESQFNHSDLYNQ